MAQQREDDFPVGHPARFDYDPASPDAKEWARMHVFPKGERDFPPGHPKAIDTPGNSNHIPIRAGVDPARPDHEAFTGRTPEQAAAARAVYQQQAEQAKDSPAALPVMASDPPKEIGIPRVRAFDGGRIGFFCPGCKSLHQLDAGWQFNGSLELPSFTPSVCVSDAPDHVICHSWVTNGKIRFLDDSVHALKGQEVDLPPIAQWDSSRTVS